MIKLNDTKLYKEHETLYEVLTDWLFERNYQAPLSQSTPVAMLEVTEDNCFLDEEGNFFAPVAFSFTSFEEEYAPEYSDKPTLTKKEIAEMVAQVEEPELNDPARTI